ncbi:MAG: hypothetical protein KDA81_21855, partial [Planctomycetaceae bacterium]|nr:hypothetical protein [Planctomycetaceae bacterium]
MRRFPQVFAAFAAVMSTCLLTSPLQADPAKGERSGSRGVITRPSYDPSAERVELFDGMKSGAIETKVIANGPEHGSLLISNTTDKPLTVDMPQSFVAV